MYQTKKTNSYNIPNSRRIATTATGSVAEIIDPKRLPWLNPHSYLK
jgi:hypothetical protein